MLSDAEKKDLVEQGNLLPGERAKINYRVAQKVKTKLLEIKGINEALCLLPEKNARKVLDDDMVDAVFTLAESMIRILGYGPLKIYEDGIVYTTRSEPPKSNDRKQITLEVIASPASNIDLVRKRLVDDHIAVLNRLMSQNFGLLLSDLPDNITSDSISGNIDPVKVNEMLARWGRPRIRTFKERIQLYQPPK